MNLARVLAVSADIVFCALSSCKRSCRVLGPNAPRGNRASGTCSLAEGGLGVFTSNEPRGNRSDASFGVEPLGGELFHPTIPPPLGHACVRVCVRVCIY